MAHSSAGFKPSSNQTYFAAEGCLVAICARNAASLKAAAEAITKKHGVEVLDQAVDVTDASAVHGFVEAVINKFGSADICVTNAGGPPAKGFMAATLED